MTSHTAEAAREVVARAAATAVRPEETGVREVHQGRPAERVAAVTEAAARAAAGTEGVAKVAAAREVVARAAAVMATAREVAARAVAVRVAVRVAGV